MATGLTLDVPFADLICVRCQREDEALEPLEGMVRDYPVDLGPGGPVLRIKLDVTRIKYAEVSPGRYEAQAVFALCPSCDDPHEVAYDRRLPAIVLTDEVWCSRCDSKLFLQSLVEVDYEEPTFRVSGKLVCPRCHALGRCEARVPAPGRAAFSEVERVEFSAVSATVVDPNPAVPSD